MTVGLNPLQCRLRRNSLASRYPIPGRSRSLCVIRTRSLSRCFSPGHRRGGAIPRRGLAHMPHLSMDQ